jgi:hypothetical protein
MRNARAAAMALIAFFALNRAIADKREYLAGDAIL